MLSMNEGKRKFLEENLGKENVDKIIDFYSYLEKPKKYIDYKSIIKILFDLYHYRYDNSIVREYVPLTVIALSRGYEEYATNPIYLQDIRRNIESFFC